MFDLGDLFIWSLVIFACIVFWRGQGVREIAMDAARRHCEQMDVQWLDGNVALRGLWLKRDRRGNIHFWRSYIFEFSSTGDERYSGRVVLLGEKVESVQLQAHRLY